MRWDYLTHFAILYRGASQKHRLTAIEGVAVRDKRQHTSHTPPANRRKQTSTQELLLFNKPFDVLSQFTDADKRTTLGNYLSAPGYYPAGRLDRDSEGLLLLTNNGALQHRISNPRFKLHKIYLVQVDGEIDDNAMADLGNGITLKDGPARALSARRVQCPGTLWPRDPPVRFRKNIPTSWLEIKLDEGRNRQVRRMTAAVGFPTLRLIRTSIGSISVWPIKQGEYRFANAAELSGHDGKG
ncbi:MAG: pseudouridine synthase [Granulosicoccus sp.]